MMKPLFSDSDLDRMFDKFQENINNATIELLQASGEMFVKYAREFRGFENHTNNLRSSIGYVVVNNGKPIIEDFEKTGDGVGSGEKGIEAGKRLSIEIAAIHNKGLVLIGVAGMEYAIYVEAMENKDVVTGASIRTEQWMKKAIETVFERAYSKNYSNTTGL